MTHDKQVGEDTKVNKKAEPVGLGLFIYES